MQENNVNRKRPEVGFTRGLIQAIRRAATPGKTANDNKGGANDDGVRTVAGQEACNCRLGENWWSPRPPVRPPGFPFRVGPSASEGSGREP